MDDLDALYRRHAPAVLRFCWGLCGDRSQAEDLVSETFVRLLTRAPRLETATALAYLLAVARNAFLNCRRRTPRETPLPEEIAAVLGITGTAAKVRIHRARARLAAATGTGGRTR